jgi:hypothetical protein
MVAAVADLAIDCPAVDREDNLMNESSSIGMYPGNRMRVRSRWLEL